MYLWSSTHAVDLPDFDLPTMGLLLVSTLDTFSSLGHTGITSATLPSLIAFLLLSARCYIYWCRVESTVSKGRELYEVSLNSQALQWPLVYFTSFSPTLLCLDSDMSNSGAQYDYQHLAFSLSVLFYCDEYQQMPCLSITSHLYFCCSVRLLSTSACQVFAFALQRTGEVFPSGSLPGLAASHRGCRYNAVADGISLRGQSAATLSAASLELTPCRPSLPHLRRLLPCRRRRSRLLADANSSEPPSLLFRRGLGVVAAEAISAAAQELPPMQRSCLCSDCRRVSLPCAVSAALHAAPMPGPLRSCRRYCFASRHQALLPTLHRYRRCFPLPSSIAD